MYRNQNNRRFGGQKCFIFQMKQMGISVNTSVTPNLFWNFVKWSPSASIPSSPPPLFFSFLSFLCNSHPQISEEGFFWERKKSPRSRKRWQFSDEISLLSDCKTYKLLKTSRQNLQPFKTLRFFCIWNFSKRLTCSNGKFEQQRIEIWWRRGKRWHSSCLESGNRRVWYRIGPRTFLSNQIPPTSLLGAGRSISFKGEKTREREGEGIDGGSLRLE